LNFQWTLHQFMHNEKLRNMYASQNIIKVIKIMKLILGGACSMLWRDEKCIQNFDWETRMEQTNRGVGRKIRLEWI